MEQLLMWLPAALALVSTGIAWGRLSGTDASQEKRLEKLEERLDRAEERNETLYQTLLRHLGSATQDIAVIKERLTRRELP